MELAPMHLAHQLPCMQPIQTIELLFKIPQRHHLLDGWPLAP